MVAVEAGEHEIGAAARAASPTTTSAPATRSSWPPSRSTEPRSPTAPTSSSSRRPAPSRRCTGSATATGAGCAPRWAAATPLDPAPPRHPRLLARGRRLRPLGRQAAADRARVGGGLRPARRRRRRSGSGRPRTSSPTRASRRSPTREYSEVFFGDELQGAAGRLLGDPAAASIRPSFRNWDLPQRRQIFAGLRCARDAEREPIAIEVHLDRRRRSAAMARDVRAGLAAEPEGAGAEVLLRRARLAALRADHRAARVLPDPGRARDPRRALGRDRRRRRRARRPWSSSARARPRRPATC